MHGMPARGVPVLTHELCIWCIWCCNCNPHEPTQVSPLTNRVSHRDLIEPGEWLSTPSSSPRGATPTHGGSWGSARRPPLHLQLVEPRSRRVSHLPQAGNYCWTGLGTPGSALAVVPEGPCQRLRGLPPHKYHSTVGVLQYCYCV